MQHPFTFDIKSSLLAGTMLAAPLATGPATAAEAAFDGPIDEMIVTGEERENAGLTAMKTPTPLIDTPQSLTVLTATQLTEQGLRSVGDILRYTPGASIGQGEGHRDQFTIRGQNTTADFFLDGVRDDVQYFRPMYNIARVEVLRGANALIFGRGGGGGVINRVTKKPDAENDFVGGLASVDTFGAGEVRGDVNAGLAEGVTARLNAYYEHLNNHRDFYDGDRFAVNPTLSFDFSDDTRLFLSYEYVDDERLVDRGVPALDGEPLRGFDSTFFGDPDANLTTFAGHIARARLDHSFSDAVSWNTTVQYANYDKLYQNLFPTGFDDQAGTVELDGYRDTTDRENLIVQTNLVAEAETGPLAHTLLIGAEFGDQQTDNARRDVQFAATQDDRITFAFSDPLSIPAFSFPAFTRNRSSDVQFFSAYLQDQIDLTDQLKLVAGLRFDRFEIDVVDRLEVADGANDSNDGFLARNDDEISPRLGLIYKPVSTVSFYASWSRSFLPRSGDQFLSLTPTTENAAPEQFDNYEVGVKWNPTETLSVTAALFRLDRDSATTVDPNDPDNSIVIGTRTEGFELQVVGQLTERWSVNAGYSYLDGDERNRFVNGVEANRTLSQVPEHMASLWNRFQVTEKLGLGAGLTFQDSQFASISNQVELPSFTRVDAAVFYDLTDSIQAQVNIENLFDADYFPAAHNDNNISTGAPLNARFTLRARF